MAKFIHLLACGLGALVTTATVLTQPIRANEQFSPQAIQFDRDSIVEFEFLRSNNSARSTFGVINLATNEKTPLLSESRAFDSKAKKAKSYVGTPGKAVRKPFAEFTFKANTPYALYLESNNKGKTTTVYSAMEKNNGSQLAQFDNDATSLGSQGVKIGWNDGTSKKAGKFDQFMVIAGGGMGCPCKPSPGITAAPQPEAPIRKPSRAPSGRG
jgi:hypothetical protein